MNKEDPHSRKVKQSDQPRRYMKWGGLLRQPVKHSDPPRRPMKLWHKIVIGLVVLFVICLLAAPMPSFHTPLSTVVEAADGTLLGARVADDGQWRFPPPGMLPEKYVTCLINYEDRYFRWHPGINPVAVIRALTDNIKAGETVSGGSTITMQVARLARGNPERTYAGKAIEMLSALKLELFHSKRAILTLYAANAPFGGNTVGIEAAAWRYTGRGTDDMTWAEAATLAVLPNAPSLIYPGRNSDQLHDKRDRLLMLLASRDIIDSLTCSLAMGEPLPGAALPMPTLAPHLTSRMWLDSPGSRVRTTVDPLLQREVSDLVNRHQSVLEGNLIHNAAAVVVEVSTGNVVAYVGNSTLPDTTGRHGRDVDMIMAPRSTGSIMKPFLYAALLSSGMMLPNTLIPDIPTRFQGFRPENFDFTYSGAVPAGDALARSLNIPAVRMLQMLEEERFLDLLHRIGFTTFTRPASHYGLSLILGGGEATLWELAGAYASMARVLKESNTGKEYHTEQWHMPSVREMKEATVTRDPSPPLSAPAVWLTYEALKRVNRPETETGWQYFGNAPEVAWKTGTSFGFRDAWAIGTTPSHVVAVWTGNADGEGRPGLSGISSSAPLLFDIIRLLPTVTASWFTRPEEGMTIAEVCAASGYRAGPDCTERREEWIPEAGLRSDACPYHTIINLDKTGKFRVNSSCSTPGEMISSSWFVLPPAMEYYYRMHNPSYHTLPPFLAGCTDDMQVPSMEFIYPPRDARIFIPRSLQGQLMSMLPEIAHRRRNATVYWHLDNRYIGMTRFVHQTEVQVGEGEHLITAVDDEGMTISRKFYCIGTL
ncbi:MAG: penicillin-binding protein 1C [Bacteroidales bacterium]|jgi:penicillin-binding protein 1C|nr:penicillin-binding protein 1C [Bacteroidales bacterium]